MERAAAVGAGRVRRGAAAIRRLRLVQVAGLTFRPLAETIRDTLSWDGARPATEPRRAGLDLAREQALLPGMAEARSEVAGGVGAKLAPLDPRRA